MSKIEITKLPKKVLVITAKLMHSDLKNVHIDNDNIKSSVSPLGFEVNTAEEVTFLYELYKLNEKNLENNTLNESNIILPVLKELTLTFFELRAETVKRFYVHNVLSYSENESIIVDAFDNNRDNNDDGIDGIYGDPSPLPDEYLDGETLDYGLDNVKVIENK
jgi:hypothetical protein